MFSNWAEAAKAAEKDKGSIERAYEFSTRIEQSPNPNSRVTLGNEKDELGVPQADLHWELSPLDKKSIRKIYRLIARQMGIAGIARVKMKDFLIDENDDSFPDSTNGGWHHMGATRMSEDPKKGVVDANCKIHGTNNLYIAGSGCFPTAGAPNPTLTHIALSLRLSDFVKSRLS
jgi:choline dehydrogenase-like flavoprotein